MLTFQPDYILTNASEAMRDVQARTCTSPNTPQEFWECALALGQKTHDYATHLVEDAVKNAEPTIAVKMNHAVGTIHAIVSDVEELKNTIAQAHGASLDDIKNGIEKVFADLLEELREQFPPPDQAPNHAERKRIVSLVLNKVEDAFVKLCVQHGMSEEQLRIRLDPIMKKIETVVVTLCDLAEQHPVLFVTLMVAGVMLIIPESWFLRPLFRIFGMAPEGPVKGAWAFPRQATGTHICARSLLALVYACVHCLCSYIHMAKLCSVYAFSPYVHTHSTHPFSFDALLSRSPCVPPYAPAHATCPCMRILTIYPQDRQSHGLSATSTVQSLRREAGSLICSMPA